MTAEVNVPNHGGRLLPGGYAQVHLDVGRTAPRLQVPVNTLLFRAEGTRAVVVDGANTLRLRPVTIGRDFGSVVEIVSGLSADDWVVINPADSADDGQTVRVERPKDAPATATPANTGAPRP
jgi:multidrug efflux pump subunit AcrA (membrane-fusion protein)